MPFSRMSNGFQSKLGDQNKKPDGYISRETVTGIGGHGAPAGYYQVLGSWIPGRDTVIKLNEVVHVEWKNGKPYRIVDFDVRRGVTRGQKILASVGIVEELFLAPSTAAGGTVTVWFRNYDQVTELRYDDDARTRLYTDFTGTAREVKWGVNKNVFGVLEKTGVAGTERIHVYRIVRESETKIISPGTVVKVAEKLGSYQLSTNGAKVICSVAIHLKRDSVESYLELVWTPVGPAGSGDAIFSFDHSQFHRDAGTNENVADCDRSLDINLTGTNSITFTNGAPIAASEIVVPSGLPPSSYSATFGDWAVDESNHPLYSVSIQFTDFGLWQGNSTTGLTGSYHLMGEGTLTNIGLCFIPLCPGVVDNIGVQDFMDHGNASGIVSTHIYEQHVVVVDAATNTIKWKTLADNVTLQLEETSDGAHPYRFVHDTGMPASPDQCGTPNNGGPGGWRAVPQIEPVMATVDMGNLGDLALIKAESSLFNQSLSFLPDLPNGNDPTPGTPTRRATVRVNVATEGYDREWPDFFGVNCSFFIAQVRQVKGMWSTDVCDVLRRYDVNVSVEPFVTSTGVSWFTKVYRQAQNPSGYASDQHQFGAFIVNSNGALTGTVRAYTSVTLGDNNTNLVLVTGDDRHVIWTETPDGASDTPWYIANYSIGLVQQVGVEDPTGQLILLAPDLLYAKSESSPKQQFFVKGWDRVTQVFDADFQESNPAYPKKDSNLSGLGILKELKDVTPGDSTDFHAIIDTRYVPLNWRT